MTGVKGRSGSGGKREGAGRKPSNVPTKTLSFRVPEKHAEGLKEAIKKAIAAYLKKNK